MIRGVLRVAENGNLGFWCPGCRDLHMVNSGWKFNGNFERPTFTPSVLVNSGHFASRFKPGDSCWCTYNAEHSDETNSLRFKCERCHSFVTDGNIQFLSDCTHALVGNTVPLPRLEY